MEAFVTEAKAYYLRCFSHTYSFPLQTICLAPVVLSGIELAMKLGIKQNTVAPVLQPYPARGAGNATDIINYHSNSHFGIIQS